MVNIHINGEKRVVAAALNLSTLLQQLEYDMQYVAVAVNQSCVKHSEYASTQLKEGDKVEILSPMSGG